MFIHSVYFWLKPGTSETAQQRLVADCQTMLATIPTVRQLWAGPPAMTPREIVDNSYAVGLTVILDDAAGHDAYQAHPQHQEFIARHKPHWARVLVYDFAG